eukprot:1160325-Pelagomonas_calceolata.AAC.9
MGAVGTKGQAGEVEQRKRERHTHPRGQFTDYLVGAVDARHESRFLLMSNQPAVEAVAGTPKQKIMCS